jgi:hypothetical protein
MKKRRREQKPLAQRREQGQEPTADQVKEARRFQVSTNARARDENRGLTVSRVTQIEET